MEQQQTLQGLMKAWHPIAWSKSLKNKPISATVMDINVVVFRNNEGRAQVMKDRCIHKGVKLSKGKCTKSGIECPYHGWIYNHDGEVVKVPSHLVKDKRPKGKVPTYKTIETQGTVWFCFDKNPDQETPMAWHFYNKPAFTTVIDIDCEYTRLMENLVDNPHAGYIHGGLLRGRPSTPVKAVIKETTTGVHIQTFGERAKKSLIYRVFGNKDEEIFHTEEYLVPNIIRTIFHHQGGTHASSQFICVPISDKKTRVFYRVTLDIFSAKIFIPFFKIMVDKVLVQDKEILEEEALLEWQEPSFKKVPCKSDTPAIWTSRIAKNFANKGPAMMKKSDFNITEVEYFL